MAEKHIAGQLETLFGRHSATARVLDFMAVFRDWDYNKQDIARNSDLSPRHATIAIERLVNLELIKKTRNVGLSQMYQYNTENKAAKLLQKFLLELAGQEAEKTAKLEIENEENRGIEAGAIPN